jgi:periplasmic divalent cation tolerance protein
LSAQSVADTLQIMLIAWTTVATPDEAENMAAEAVARSLAACVEITGVVTHYRWQDKLERAEELRLTFKCMPDQLPALEAFVFENHPYDTPEWIVLSSERVAEKYLSWATANSKLPPL